MRRHGSKSRGDAGFTLPELLVVLITLPLLMGALAAMIISLLNNTVPKDPHGAAVRLADSHDAQLASAYFNRDVQGTAYVSTFTTPLCSPTNGPNQLVGLEWKSGTQTIDVSYYVQQAPLSLVRYYCSSSSAPASYPVTPVSSSLLTNNLFSATPAASITSCPVAGFGSGATKCATNGGSTAYLALTVTCFNGTCPAASLNSLPGLPAHPSASGGIGVATIQIQAQESLSTYHFSLTASPRVTNPSQTFINPGQFPPLIVSSIVSGGNCAISTNGAMAVNSISDGSITNQPGGTVTATGGVFTSDTNPTGSTSGAKGTIPPPVYAPPAVSPYQGLTEPPTAPAGALYPVVTESASNWDPSTDTTVESGGVLSAATYPHGAIFIVQNGLNISKAFSAPQGVLFYVSGGNVSLNGNGALFLNPLNPNFESPTQPVPEVVLWISKNDTTPSNPPTLTLGGNGNTTAINGAVYAPTAAVTMDGGGSNGGFTVQAMNIGTLTACNGGGAVTPNITVGLANTSTTVVPSSASITLGSSLTAKATVAGPTTPTGTVTFYWCGPTASASGCGQTAGWSNTLPFQVGAGPVTLAPGAITNTATATSASYTPTATGSYCFAAYYNPSGAFNASNDTLSDGCFTVTAAAPPAPVIIVPAPSPTCYGKGGCSSWPGAFSGTAAQGALPLTSLTITIADPAGKYWDPTTTGFSSTTPVPLSATLTPAGPGNWTWSYSFSSLNFEGGNNTYTLSVVSGDGTNTSPTASVKFTVKG